MQLKQLVCQMLLCAQTHSRGHRDAECMQLMAHLVAVDEASQVGVAHLGPRQREARLLGAGLVKGACIRVSPQYKPSTSAQGQG